jgi:hypothetical protein
MLSVLDDDAPVRLMAQLLAERGFEVRHPEDEDSQLLRVTGARSARCEIEVGDYGCIEWEYFPQDAGSTGAAEISRLVLLMLGTDRSSSPGPGPGLGAPANPAVTLKGAVARKVQAHGLKARLKVHENQESYDVYAEVVFSNPEKPERGIVSVTDDGIVLWECDYERMQGGAAAVADATADMLVGFPAREH